MLVLSRKINESIFIDGQIQVTVLGIRGNQVRLGIQAPKEVQIFREEVRMLTRDDPCSEAVSMGVTSTSRPAVPAL